MPIRATTPHRKKKKNPTARKSAFKKEKTIRTRARRGAQQCPQPPAGTVGSQVIFIIEGLTAARRIRDFDTLDDVGLGPQRLTMCLNDHFFKRPRRGIPNRTFNGDTRISQVIGTVYDHLAAQGLRSANPE